MHFRALVPLAMLGTAIGMIAACSERALLTAPELETLAPSADIVDGAHNDGNAGFYWLHPLATPPASFTGQFDPTLPVEVRICNWQVSFYGGAGGCWGPDEVFTTHGPGSSTVRAQLQDDQYVLNWNTKNVFLPAPTSNTFRVRVRVGTFELGHIDLQGVYDGSMLKDVDSDAFAGFVIGKTVAIKFRVEEGAVPASNGEGLIAAGGAHTCGISESASTYCWGWNADRQAGNDNGHETLVPTPIFAASFDFSQLAAGGLHTCGLVRPGVAFCWGGNNLGQLGASGFGSFSSMPRQVTGGHLFRSVSAGELHTCALTHEGLAYCWGSMYGGSTPVAVAGGHTFKALDAGNGHTCGIRTDGTAYCWGRGAEGQLGNGTQLPLEPGFNPTPVPVAGGLTFDRISAGTRHTCALTPSGDAYCWGAPVVPGEFDLTPVAVSGGFKFVALSAGNGHNCGFTGDGTAYCWGANSSGQLGNGSITALGADVPAVVSGSAKYVAISSGGVHTCGITTIGTAQCWGSNDQGRSGTGDNTGSAIPIAVSGDVVFHIR